MDTMLWLLLATGFTGALTLRFVYRQVVRLFVPTPSVGAHFSPRGGCTEVIVAELKKAHKEVLVLAYSFTSREVAQALIDAKLRGVHVEVILDHSNEKEKYTDLPFFLEQGLHPLIDAEHAIAHNKVMVIDGRTVLTGSFNFTHQAEQENAENLLVIKGHPELVRAYRENFAHHKGHARAPDAKAAPAVSAPPPHSAHAEPKTPQAPAPHAPRKAA
jgi:phosphatidylserine/phosphatidylglycerophosphate/cardiolipin synthase-like enzyme